jgi:SAM-dependent methyltransferase
VESSFTAGKGKSILLFMSPSSGCQKLMKLSHRHPRPSPWWFRPDYGSEDYSRRFYEIFGRDFSLSEAEKKFYESLIPKGCRALDIGCGGGDFVLFLARNGVNTTGIDLGPYPIEQAWEKAEAEELNARFLCADVFEENFKAPFDRITLLGSQLQEFPPEEVERLFQHIPEILAPEGLFIVQSQRLMPSEHEYSSYWYLPELCLYTDKKALVLGENFYYPEEKVRVLREYALELKSGRLLIGGSTEKEYSPEELRQFAEKAGLVLKEYYGDWDRSDFEEGSPHLITIFQSGEEPGE